MEHSANAEPARDHHPVCKYNILMTRSNDGESTSVPVG